MGEIRHQSSCQSRAKLRVSPVVSSLYWRLDLYCLPVNYVERKKVIYCDQRTRTEEYQKEVYEVARLVAERLQCSSVLDFGCGSGFKLLKNFPDLVRLGVDLPPTVAWLREKYPAEMWSDSLAPSPGFDLMIASDVIEHLENPLMLVEYCYASKPKICVISTPDRSLRPSCEQLGPPRNPMHFREWAFDEFRAFLGQYFKVIDHVVVNRRQCTQLAVVALREGASKFNDFR